MYREGFRSNKYISWVIMLLSWIALGWQLHQLSIRPIDTEAAIYLVFFSGLTVVLLTSNRMFERIIPFRLNFLLTTFSMLIAWRLSVLANLDHTSQIYLVALILKLINYLLAAYHDIKKNKRAFQANGKENNVAFEWQLTFIRMFIGFDLVPHFCEKLFSGASGRAGDIQAFTELQIPYVLYFVIAAGLIEFFGSLAISCGILTRLGSLGLCMYLMVATYLGNHFKLGFIWASAGGGWEFPVFWAALILSFSLFGAGKFSFDAYFSGKFKLPKIILWAMGGLSIKR